MSLKTEKCIDLQLSEAWPGETIAHNKVVRDAGEILIYAGVFGEAGGTRQWAENWLGTLGIVWSCKTEYDLEMQPSEVLTKIQNILICGAVDVLQYHVWH